MRTRSAHLSAPESTRCSNQPSARIAPVERGACARRANKHLPPVGQCDISAIGDELPALGLVPFDQNFNPGRDRLFGPATPHKRAGGTAFNHPLLHRAVWLLDVDVNPRMRVDPFHPGDGSTQPDGLVGVEFSRERVMCQCRDHPHSKHDAGNRSYHRSHQIRLLLLLRRFFSRLLLRTGAFEDIDHPIITLVAGVLDDFILGVIS